MATTKPATSTPTARPAVQKPGNTTILGSHLKTSGSFTHWGKNWVEVATRTGNRCISLWSYAPVVSFLIVLLQRDITPRKMLLRFVGRLSLSSTLAILWGLCLA
ncbi:hypothetical protein LINGRAHAP2_LOCUS22288 [Linum grandiflorum]